MPHGLPTVDPMSLAQALVGLPYVPGECDCGTLAVRAARELFGREVVLPQSALEARTGREQGQVIAACRRLLARPVLRPDLGDVALMWESSRRAGRQWHLGTAVRLAPSLWVLHTREHAGSQLSRMSDLRRWGLHLDGWYRWLDREAGPEAT